MSLQILVSLLVAIVGALYYLVSKDGERKTLGLWAWGCGLLVTLLCLGATKVHLP